MPDLSSLAIAQMTKGKQKKSPHGLFISHEGFSLIRLLQNR